MESEVRRHSKLGSGSLKSRDHLVDLGVDRNIILKSIF
jgi:hypothetical protein